MVNDATVEKDEVRLHAFELTGSRMRAKSSKDPGIIASSTSFPLLDGRYVLLRHILTPGLRSRQGVWVICMLAAMASTDCSALLEIYASLPPWFSLLLQFMRLVALRPFIGRTLSTMPIATSRESSPSDRPAKRSKMSDDPVQQEMTLPVEHVKSYAHEIDYREKLVLAPMVRSGTCKWSSSAC